MAGLEPNTERAKEAIEKNVVFDVGGLGNPNTFAQAEQFLDTIFSLNQFNKSRPQQEGFSRPSLSLRNYQTQIQNVVDELNNSGKMLTFILSQAALHLLNPTIGRGKILNPAAIIFGPPPFFGGVLTNTLDVGISYNDPTTRNPGNTLGLMYNGTHVEARIEAGVPPFSVEGPSVRFPKNDGSALNSVLTNVVGGQTYDQLGKDLSIIHRPADGEQRLDQTIIADPYNKVNIVTENINGVNIERPDYESIFNKRPAGPGFLGPNRGGPFFQPLDGARAAVVNQSMVGAQRNFDSFFNLEDLENGFMTKLVDETTSVVPFYFEDMRAVGRYLYFRAFIENFNESITPDWNREKFYGRIDKVLTYMNTERSFNVVFKIVAMSKAGLTTMWRKINNLCKMVYPTYNNGIMAAGPVIRLRIGDVVASEVGGAALGLPGIISNLEFDYSSAPWELETFQSNIQQELGKAPQWATISFGFEVIHEENPSIDIDYNFNSKNFRRMGTLVSDVANLNGSSQNSSEPERTSQNAVGTTGTDSDTGTTEAR